MQDKKEGTMALTAPVIVVPGITASELRDEYILPPDTVWSAVLNKEYDRIALHPDNVRYEAREPARVTADHIFELAYKELLNELRYNLREREDRPVPVFSFSYDWRQPLDRIESELAAFIDEVVERTKLLKHYHDAGYSDKPSVSLVGHSMGAYQRWRPLQHPSAVLSNRSSRYQPVQQTWERIAPLRGNVRWPA